MVIFETPRLSIRRLRKEDQENFYHFYSNPEVMRYIMLPQDREKALFSFKENIEFYKNNPSFGTWAIIDKSSDRFIGSCKLKPSAVAAGFMEIGYAFLKEYWGKGLASEIVKAGLKYAFEDCKLPSVVAVTHLDNSASQNVLLKAGFTQLENTRTRDEIVNLFIIKNKNIVETGSLTILALTHEQLKLYLEANDKFEHKFRLAINGRNISQDVKEMVDAFTLPKMQVAREDNYLFYTFWIVVETVSKTIVAELGFKGEPNEKGEIEIGYGTMPDHRGRGYMTEAVGGMIHWAKMQKGINFILASVDETNIASIRIIEKNGFEFVEKKGELLWWKIPT